MLREAHGNSRYICILHEESSKKTEEKQCIAYTFDLIEAIDWL